jgi:aryl-alcohol dehydrogenase-like predicted oxidoreductase
MMMKKLIPGSGLEASCLCLGTAWFGSTMDEKASFDLMDAFVEQGGNFLDTAHSYADWVKGLEGQCVSEKTIGAWMKARKNRDSVIVGTKGGWVNPKTRKLMSSREELTAQLESSRSALQTGCIDLYWLHYDNPAYPVAHFIDFLNEQVDAGRIRCFACSNWPVARIREANDYALAHGLRTFVANQLWWSLAAPDLVAYGDPTVVGMDAGGMAFHRSTGMAAMAYSPQGKGFFNKLDERGLDGIDAFQRKIFATPANIARLPRIKEVAAQAGASIAQVLVAYLLSQSFPAFPIIGASSREQLLDSVKAVDVKLTPDMVRRLE